MIGANRITSEQLTQDELDLLVGKVPGFRMTVKNETYVLVSVTDGIAKLSPLWDLDGEDFPQSYVIGGMLFGPGEHG